MVKVEELYALYRVISSQEKAVKIFEGKHASGRPEKVKRDAVEFLVACFQKEKSRHEEKEKGNSKRNWREEFGLILRD